MNRKYDFHDGQRGAALAVRVTPRASRNQIVDMLNDGTIKIHLASEPADAETNIELVKFLSDVLDVPTTRLEVVAGENGRDKLVSVVNMDVATAHARVTARIEALNVNNE